MAFLLTSVLLFPDFGFQTSVSALQYLPHAQSNFDFCFRRLLPLLFPFLLPQFVFLLTPFPLYVTTISMCIHKGRVLQAQGMCKFDMMPTIRKHTCTFNLQCIHLRGILGSTLCLVHFVGLLICNTCISADILTWRNILHEPHGYR